MPPLLEVFLRFLRLGFTAFGGPIAHIGYFEREFVERAKWLERAAYAELVALCTVLPGPTSSQVGMLLGAHRAGPLGGIAAWVGFTLPSATLMAIVGTYAVAFDDIPAHGGRPPGLPLGAAREAFDGAYTALVAIAFAVVLLAVINLARSIVVTPFARAVAPLAFLIAIGAFAYASSLTWIALAIGGVLGFAFGPRRAPMQRSATFGFVVSKRLGIACFAALVALLTIVPAFATEGMGRLFATTVRAGSLVFGGGHVVLAFLSPMSSTREVPPGLFAFGYGVVQAVPGPLFTFASFLGAADFEVPNRALGALVATLGIFLPSFLILPAALALWSGVRDRPRAGAVLAGLSAGVVGLLAATFLAIFLPAFEGGFRLGFPLLAASALALLMKARWPAWAVVLVLVAGAAGYDAIASALALPAVLRLG